VLTLGDINSHTQHKEYLPFAFAVKRLTQTVHGLLVEMNLRNSWETSCDIEPITTFSKLLWLEPLLIEAMEHQTNPQRL
jgi:hypothetical protein